MILQEPAARRRRTSQLAIPILLPAANTRGLAQTGVKSEAGKLKM
jgi:hypothetical protein